MTDTPELTEEQLNELRERFKREWEQGPHKLILGSNQDEELHQARARIAELEAERDALRAVCRAVLDEQRYGSPDRIISPELEARAQEVLQDD